MKNWYQKIVVLVGILLVASCQELPRYFVGDKPLARVDEYELKLSEVKSVVPQGVTGEDSVAFMKVYIDRWVKKHIKLREAEIQFSEAEADIDRMVEEYRQTLLIRKLDRENIDRNIDTTFTAHDIEAYYDTHKADFKLDRTLVKGRVLKFKSNYRTYIKLKKLMASKSESQQKDFTDLCLKNEYTLTDFREHWVDFTEFLSYLPTPRTENHDSMLSTTEVQEMRDYRWFYYFQIDEVLREGQPIPVERVRSTIRRILYNQRQGELSRQFDETLYQKAWTEGIVEIFSNEDQNDKETVSNEEKTEVKTERQTTSPTPEVVPHKDTTKDAEAVKQ